jgi:hypothetical protein
VATSLKPHIVKERQQHERRKGVTLRDQFGRVYQCEIDVDSLDPVGPIALRDARPPVPVPDFYVRPVPGELGRIFCHLEEWRLDLLSAHEDWKRRLRERAQKMYGDQAANALRTRPPELLDIVGPEPMPVQFCEAQIAGNKWALGLRVGAKGFHPRPTWVTDALLELLEKATRTVWNASDKVKAKPVDVSLYSDEAYDGDETARVGSSGALDDDADDEGARERRIGRAMFDDDDEDASIPAAPGEELEPSDADRAALLREERALDVETDAEARHLYDETPARGKRGRTKNNGGTDG